MATDTRERILNASAELFRQQGYNATGVKQIVAAAQAPFGSIYHFFPGGKEELGAATIRLSGALYEQLIPAVLDTAPDLVTGVRNFFAGAAQHLVETDYADACPIATVALEVSSASEPMREACAEVFESWTAAGAARHDAAGIAPERARDAHRLCPQLLLPAREEVVQRPERGVGARDDLLQARARVPVLTEELRRDVDDPVLRARRHACSPRLARTCPA